MSVCARTYDTLIHTSGGCDSAVTLNLSISSLPNVSMTKDSHQNICSGDSVLIGMDSPEIDVQYQWARDGNILAGETSSSVMIHDDGVYVLYAQQDSDVRLLLLRLQLLRWKTHGVGCSYTWLPAKPLRSGGDNEGEKITVMFLDPTEVSLTVYNQLGSLSASNLLP